MMEFGLLLKSVMMVTKFLEMVAQIARKMMDINV